jgi:hypothetical protein
MVNLKYAMAAVLTINLFFIILSVVDYMDLQRLLRFSNDLASFSTSAQDLQTSISMISLEKNPEHCSIIDAAYRNEIAQTDALMDKMLGYERANMFAEFFALKRQFLLSNVQLWQVSQAEREYCAVSHSDILYVYSSNPGCQDCQVQGGIIDSVRTSCPNVRVFVMDIEEKLTTLEIIRNRYNISSAPSLVINGNTYDGIMDENAMRREVGC